MQVIIKDLTQQIQETGPLKKIELVSCLQQNMEGDGENYFYRSKVWDVNIRSIYKVGSEVVNGFDLIIINDKNVFLGHWNDGVL